MTNIVILGAGMAGLGAAHRLHAEGLHTTVLEKRSHIGGHASTRVSEGGWVFDEGPHISFTKNRRMQELFAASVGGQYEAIKAEVNNYWKGQWIKHPAQVNLYGLPTELLVKTLEELIRAQFQEPGPVANYEDWLVASFGRTFAETFPMQYGRKYHTTDAANMTTDWVGPRLYRPALAEVLRGALSPQTPDVHYITDFRYPSHGGFVSYLKPFGDRADVRFGHEVTQIDPTACEVEIANGARLSYDCLISSLPLPELIPRIAGAPQAVREAAAQLACTTCVIVNLGLDREDVSPAHWTYFYDQDFCFSRLSFPHMLSPHNVPPGKGAIQAEVYYSWKYKPLDRTPESCIDLVLADLKRCGLVRDDDRVVFRDVMVAQYANVIFDLERPAALKTVRDYLDEVGIETAGRYGEWSYAWTDESFMSGEHAAQRVLDRLSSQAVDPTGLPPAEER
jgi:protoporphyrinogen oxidase